ncbi:MAG: hypothetical protein ACTS5A_00875 [Candidatus Hodgkinia cicadicola]
MFEKKSIEPGGSDIKPSDLRFSWLRRRIRPVEWTIDELNQTNAHAKTLNNTSFDWKPLPW